MLFRVDPVRVPRRVRRRTRVVRWIAALVVVLLLPVPWQLRSGSAVGMAWGMDNRLRLDGERVDPPGQWSWLTAGRPSLVAELLHHHALEALGGAPEPVARDLRVGAAPSRPVNVEPMAAAIGVAAATGGIPVEDIVPIDAVIGGHGPPYSWVRSLATGPSHGLMVGLVAYASVAEEDLAGGRHVAGTGALGVDGRVHRIGGLAAKAGAARRAGADVLLIPASQRRELAGVDTGTMRVLAVHTLWDAIVQLRATAPMP